MFKPITFPILVICSVILTACSLGSSSTLNHTSTLDVQNNFQRYSPQIPDLYILNSVFKEKPVYKNIKIESPLISIAENCVDNSVNPNFLKFVTDILNKQTREVLSRNFNISSSSSVKTLKLKILLKNLIIPNQKVATAAISSGSIPIGLKNSFLEVYFEDSLSGEIIGGVQDLRIGQRTNLNFLNGFTTIKYIERAFMAWAEDISFFLKDFVSPIKDDFKDLNTLQQNSDNNPSQNVQELLFSEEKDLAPLCSAMENELPTTMDQKELFSPIDLMFSDENKEKNGVINY